MLKALVVAVGYMESLIRDLLSQLGASLDSPPLHPPCPGISLLGILTNPPQTRHGSLLKSGTFVWHAHDGWAPLDNLEIERWLVDAPEGDHWLLSERPLRVEKKPVKSGVEYRLWGPEKFGQWLGDAILNGDLVANIPRKISVNNEGGSENAPVRNAHDSTETGPCALRPQVNLEDVLDKLNLRNVEPRPVLLRSRIWSVTGILRGPDDAAERQWWTFLEDSFSGEIDNLTSVEALDFIPELEHLSPPAWSNEVDIIPRIANLCEERRHYSVTESSAGQKVKGSVLHWWKLDPSSAEMNPRLALLPAWQIRLANYTAIVHGLTGALIPLSKSS